MRQHFRRFADSAMAPARGLRGSLRWPGVFLLAASLALFACGGDSSSGGGAPPPAAGSGGPVGGAVTGTLVTVNTAQSFQTISGWEVAASVADRPASISQAEANNFANAAVNQAGITRLRLGVRSGYEGQIGAFAAYAATGDQTVYNPRRYPVVNDNNDPFSINPAGFDFGELDFRVQYAVLPVRDALAARGEKLHLNVNYVSFLAGAPSAHEDPEEYAEYALAVALHLRQAFGLEIDSWEVMLEPDLREPRWDGRRIGLSILATARRFDQNGIKAKFIGPSTTNMANASIYFDGILTVPGAVDRMSELSYHRYAGVSPAALQAIVQRAQQHNLGTSMLEWWFGNADQSILFEDLKANNVAFQGRALSGLFVNGPTTGALQLEREIRYNSLIYRTVRPGAVRVGAASAGSPFDAIAFRRPDGKYLVALNSTAGGSATIRGLPAGSYTVSTVTAGAETGPTAVTQQANGDVVVTISGTGVLVVQPA